MVTNVQVVFLVDVNCFRKYIDDQVQLDTYKTAVNLICLRLLTEFGAITDKGNDKVRWSFKFYNSQLFKPDTTTKVFLDFNKHSLDKLSEDIQEAVNTLKKQRSEQDSKTNEANFTNHDPNARPRHNLQIKPNDNTEHKPPCHSFILKKSVQEILVDYNWDPPDLSSPIKRNSNGLIHSIKSNTKSPCNDVESINELNLVITFTKVPATLKELALFIGEDYDGTSRPTNSVPSYFFKSIFDHATLIGFKAKKLRYHLINLSESKVDIKLRATFQADFNKLFGCIHEYENLVQVHDFSCINKLAVLESNLENRSNIGQNQFDLFTKPKLFKTCRGLDCGVNGNFWWNKKSTSTRSRPFQPGPVLQWVDKDGISFLKIKLEILSINSSSSTKYGSMAVCGVTRGGAMTLYGNGMQSSQIYACTSTDQNFNIILSILEEQNVVLLLNIDFGGLAALKPWIGGVGNLVIYSTTGLISPFLKDIESREPLLTKAMSVIIRNTLKTAPSVAPKIKACYQAKFKPQIFKTWFPQAQVKQSMLPKRSDYKYKMLQLAMFERIQKKYRPQMPRLLSGNHKQPPVLIDVTQPQAAAAEPNVPVASKLESRASQFVNKSKIVTAQKKVKEQQAEEKELQAATEERKKAYKNAAIKSQALLAKALENIADPQDKDKLAFTMIQLRDEYSDEDDLYATAQTVIDVAVIPLKSTKVSSTSIEPYLMNILGRKVLLLAPFISEAYEGIRQLHQFKLQCLLRLQVLWVLGYPSGDEESNSKHGELKEIFFKEILQILRAMAQRHNPSAVSDFLQNLVVPKYQESLCGILEEIYDELGLPPDFLQQSEEYDESPKQLSVKSHCSLMSNGPYSEDLKAKAPKEIGKSARPICRERSNFQIYVPRPKRLVQKVKENKKSLKAESNKTQKVCRNLFKRSHTISVFGVSKSLIQKTPSKDESPRSKRKIGLKRRRSINYESGAVTPTAKKRKVLEPETPANCKGTTIFNKGRLRKSTGSVEIKESPDVKGSYSSGTKTSLTRRRSFYSGARSRNFEKGELQLKASSIQRTAERTFGIAATSSTDAKFLFSKIQKSDCKVLDFGLDDDTTENELPVDDVSEHCSVYFGRDDKASIIGSLRAKNKVETPLKKVKRTLSLVDTPIKDSSEEHRENNFNIFSQNISESIKVKTSNCLTPSKRVQFSLKFTPAKQTPFVSSQTPKSILKTPLKTLTKTPTKTPTKISDKASIGQLESLNNVPISSCSENITPKKSSFPVKHIKNECKSKYRRSPRNVCKNSSTTVIDKSFQEKEKLKNICDYDIDKSTKFSSNIKSQVKPKSGDSGVCLSFNFFEKASPKESNPNSGEQLTPNSLNDKLNRATTNKELTPQKYRSPANNQMTLSFSSLDLEKLFHAPILTPKQALLRSANKSVSVKSFHPLSNPHKSWKCSPFKSSEQSPLVTELINPDEMSECFDNSPHKFSSFLSPKISKKQNENNSLLSMEIEIISPLKYPKRSPKIFVGRARKHLPFTKSPSKFNYNNFNQMETENINIRSPICKQIPVCNLGDENCDSLTAMNESSTYKQECVLSVDSVAKSGESSLILTNIDSMPMSIQQDVDIVHSINESNNEEVRLATLHDGKTQYDPSYRKYEEIPIQEDFELMTSLLQNKSEIEPFDDLPSEGDVNFHENITTLIGTLSSPQKRNFVFGAQNKLNRPPSLKFQDLDNFYSLNYAGSVVLPTDTNKQNSYETKLENSFILDDDDRHSLDDERHSLDDDISVVSSSSVESIMADENSSGSSIVIPLSQSLKAYMDILNTESNQCRHNENTVANAIINVNEMEANMTKLISCHSSKSESTSDIFPSKPSKQLTDSVNDTSPYSISFPEVVTLPLSPGLTSRNPNPFSPRAFTPLTSETTPILKESIVLSTKSQDCNQFEFGTETNEPLDSPGISSQKITNCKIQNDFYPRTAVLSYIKNEETAAELKDSSDKQQFCIKECASLIPKENKSITKSSSVSSSIIGERNQQMPTVSSQNKMSVVPQNSTVGSNECNYEIMCTSADLSLSSFDDTNNSSFSQKLEYCEGAKLKDRESNKNVNNSLKKPRLIRTNIYPLLSDNSVEENSKITTENGSAQTDKLLSIHEIDNMSKEDYNCTELSLKSCSKSNISNIPKILTSVFDSSVSKEKFDIPSKHGPANGNLSGQMSELDYLVSDNYELTTQEALFHSSTLESRSCSPTCSIAYAKTNDSLTTVASQKSNKKIISVSLSKENSTTSDKLIDSTVSYLPLKIDSEDIVSSYSNASASAIGQNVHSIFARNRKEKESSKSKIDALSSNDCLLFSQNSSPSHVVEKLSNTCKSAFSKLFEDTIGVEFENAEFPKKICDEDKMKLNSSCESVEYSESASSQNCSIQDKDYLLLKNDDDSSFKSLGTGYCKLTVENFPQINSPIDNYLLLQNDDDSSSKSLGNCKKTVKKCSQEESPIDNYLLLQNDDESSTKSLGNRKLMVEKGPQVDSPIDNYLLFQNEEKLCTKSFDNCKLKMEKDTQVASPIDNYLLLQNHNESSTKSLSNCKLTLEKSPQEDSPIDNYLLLQTDDESSTKSLGNRKLMVEKSLQVDSPIDNYLLFQNDDDSSSKSIGGCHKLRAANNSQLDSLDKENSRNKHINPKDDALQIIEEPTESLNSFSQRTNSKDQCKQRIKLLTSKNLSSKVCQSHSTSEYDKDKPTPPKEKITYGSRTPIQKRKQKFDTSAITPKQKEKVFIERKTPKRAAKVGINYAEDNETFRTSKRSAKVDINYSEDNIFIANSKKFINNSMNICSPCTNNDEYTQLSDCDDQVLKFHPLKTEGIVDTAKINEFLPAACDATKQMDNLLPKDNINLQTVERTPILLFEENGNSKIDGYKFIESQIKNLNCRDKPNMQRRVEITKVENNSLNSDGIHDLKYLIVHKKPSMCSQIEATGYEGNGPSILSNDSIIKEQITLRKEKKNTNTLISQSPTASRCHQGTPHKPKFFRESKTPIQKSKRKCEMVTPKNESRALTERRTPKRAAKIGISYIDDYPLDFVLESNEAAADISSEFQPKGSLPPKSQMETLKASDLNQCSEERLCRSSERTGRINKINLEENYRLIDDLETQSNNRKKIVHCKEITNINDKKGHVVKPKLKKNNIYKHELLNNSQPNAVSAIDPSKSLTEAIMNNNYSPAIRIPKQCKENVIDKQLEKSKRLNASSEKFSPYSTASSYSAASCTSKRLSDSFEVVPPKKIYCDFSSSSESQVSDTNKKKPIILHIRRKKKIKSKQYTRESKKLAMKNIQRMNNYNNYSP